MAIIDPQNIQKVDELDKRFAEENDHVFVVGEDDVSVLSPISNIPLVGNSDFVDLQASISDDIASATAGLALETYVDGEIASAKAEIYTDVSNDISSATAGLALESYVDDNIATATADIFAEVEDDIASAISGLALKSYVDDEIVSASANIFAEVENEIASATSDFALESYVDSEISTATATLATSAQLSSLQNDVNGNADALLSLDSRVEDTESGISSNASAILGIQGDITDIETDVGKALSGDFQAFIDLSGEVSTNEDDISSNASLISSISGTVSDIGDDVDDILEGNFDAFVDLEGEVSIIDGKVSTNASAILGVESDISDINADNTATIRSDSEPSERPSGDDLESGDIWIDSDDDETSYVWDGSSWAPYEGDLKSTVSTATSSILDLQNTVNDDVLTAIASLETSIDFIEADPGNVVIRKDEPAPTERGTDPEGDPISLKEGDLWVNTSTDTEDEGTVYSWDGSDWEETEKELKGAFAGLDIKVGANRDDLDTISAKASLFVNADGNIASVDLLADSDGTEITIAADQVNIDATTVFSSGYKIQDGLDDIDDNAQGYADNAEDNAKDHTDSLQTTLDDIFEDAITDGTTIINGGYIDTSFINTDAIAVGDLSDGDDYALESYADSQAETERDTARDTLAVELGYDHYDDMVSTVGTTKRTIIIGGYLNTSIVEAESIVASMIDVDDIFTKEIHASGSIGIGGSASSPALLLDGSNDSFDALNSSGDWIFRIKPDGEFPSGSLSVTDSNTDTGGFINEATTTFVTTDLTSGDFIPSKATEIRFRIESTSGNSGSGTLRLQASKSSSGSDWELIERIDYSFSGDSGEDHQIIRTFDDYQRIRLEVTNDSGQIYIVGNSNDDDHPEEFSNISVAQYEQRTLIDSNGLYAWVAPLRISAITGAGSAVNVGQDVDWDDIEGKPSEFEPEDHSHSFDDLPISSSDVDKWNDALSTDGGTMDGDLHMDFNKITFGDTDEWEMYQSTSSGTGNLNFAVGSTIRMYLDQAGNVHVPTGHIYTDSGEDIEQVATREWVESVAVTSGNYVKDLEVEDDVDTPLDITDDGDGNYTIDVTDHLAGGDLNMASGALSVDTTTIATRSWVEGKDYATESWVGDNYASDSHTHSTLSTGTGLSGSDYNGGANRTFSFDSSWGDGRYALSSRELTLSGTAGILVDNSSQTLSDDRTWEISFDTSILGDNLSSSGGQINVTGLSSGAFTSVDDIRSGTTKSDVGLSNVSNDLQVPRSGGTFTGYVRFDDGLMVDTNSASNNFMVSRSGSSSSQVMSIGVNDRQVDFRYIEDTSGEGNGNFGQYRFYVGGNDGESDVLTLAFNHNFFRYKGDDVVTEGSSPEFTNATVDEVRFNNNESASSTNGAVAFDSSEGLLIYRTFPSAGSGNYKILDGGNVVGGAGINVTGGKGASGEDVTFSFDTGVLGSTLVSSGGILDVDSDLKLDSLSVGHSQDNYPIDITAGSSSGNNYGLRIRANNTSNGNRAILQFTNTTNNDSSGDHSSYIAGERNSDGRELIFATSTGTSAPTDSMALRGDKTLETFGDIRINNSSPARLYFGGSEQSSQEAWIEGDHRDSSGDGNYTMTIASSESSLGVYIEGDTYIKGSSPWLNVDNTSENRGGIRLRDNEATGSQYYEIAFNSGSANSLHIENSDGDGLSLDSNGNASIDVSSGSTSTPSLSVSRNNDGSGSSVLDLNINSNTTNRYYIQAFGSGTRRFHVTTNGDIFSNGDKVATQDWVTTNVPTGDDFVRTLEVDDPIDVPLTIDDDGNGNYTIDIKTSIAGAGLTLLSGALSVDDNGHNHTASNISDATTVGNNLLTASSQTSARNSIGLGTSDDVEFDRIDAGGKVSTDEYYFVPSSHSRTKYRLYGDNSTYGIGTIDNATYGKLNNMAITFQNFSSTDRGFWWGAHSDDPTSGEGAMALTMAGHLTIKDAHISDLPTSDTGLSAGDLYTRTISQVSGGSLSSTERVICIKD